MFRILVFLVAALFQGALAQEDCIPYPVSNLRLNWNYLLRWNPSTNCEGVVYLIYVHYDDDNLQYIFTANETYKDMSTLPACENFHFTVRAYSEHHVSEDRRIEAYIPAPSAANLTITTFNVTGEGKNVRLSWEVDERYKHCAGSFRVVIRDGHSLPRDVYTQNTYLNIDRAVPCAKYVFTVTTIYSQEVEGPIVSKNYDAPAIRADPPDLIAVSTDETSANMTFAMESYFLNQCAITAVMVNGNYYSKTYEYTDSVARAPLTVVASPLKPDSMYFMQAEIVNSAGTSSPLRIGIQTKPAAS